MQRENMYNLAAYLLGDIQSRFDMSSFCQSGNEYKSTVCGSVGCAIGHNTYLVDKLLDEGWLSYSFRTLVSNINEWLWCFSNRWNETDNTKEGAAKRILWLLEYGLPEDWLNQRDGKSPLCYENMSFPVNLRTQLSSNLKSNSMQSA